MPHVHEGRCLCGDVQWTAEGDLGFRGQKASLHGEAFTSVLLVTDNVGFDIGEPREHLPPYLSRTVLRAVIHDNDLFGKAYRADTPENFMNSGLFIENRNHDG